MVGDGRRWACSQAVGVVLEVAIGTGRNLSNYPDGVRLVGVDLSPAMLEIARNRVRGLGVNVALVEGDAQRLPFADGCFDTVVCVLGLSSIPDDRVALGEMHRVLRGGGRLILLGHVASHNRAVRAAQRVIERHSLRIAGDHQTRQVHPLVHHAGFAIEYRRRHRLGVIERLTAIKLIPRRSHED